jgi:hypothetical protein
VRLGKLRRTSCKEMMYSACQLEDVSGVLVVNLENKFRGLEPPPYHAKGDGNRNEFRQKFSIRFLVFVRYRYIGVR